MIRPATVSDIPALLRMAETFIEKAWARIGVPYCGESCTSVLEGLLENGVLLIANDGKGMIGVLVHPWHFNRNVLTATELFWWCDEGCKAGAALREGAEERAREMGALTLNMACEHEMRSPALERLYRMNGFRPSEHIFIKEL